MPADGGDQGRDGERGRSCCSFRAVIGTIEAGKAADIVAVAQDPTRDIKVLERMQFVMRGGMVYVGP